MGLAVPSMSLRSPRFTRKTFRSFYLQSRYASHRPLCHATSAPIATDMNQAPEPGLNVPGTPLQDHVRFVWASPSASRLADMHLRRIEFVSYGPIFCLPLLSTLSRNDAVMGDYRPVAKVGRGLTPRWFCALSRALTRTFGPSGFCGCLPGPSPPGYDCSPPLGLSDRFSRMVGLCRWDSNFRAPVAVGKGAPAADNSDHGRSCLNLTCRSQIAGG